MIVTKFCVVYISHIWHKLHFYKKNQTFYENKNGKLENKTRVMKINGLKWKIQDSTLNQMCHLCMKDIKKTFCMFDSLLKMKLVPNVRDINDAK